MLDLYLVICPIFGTVALLTLVNLKLSLNQPKQKDLQQYQKKSQPQTPTEQKTQSQPASPYKKTLKFLLNNFTLAEVFVTRRSSNKIPMILSTLIIAILSITVDVKYVFCFVGTVVCAAWWVGKLLGHRTAQQQTMVSTIQFNPQALSRKDDVTKKSNKKSEDKLQNKLDVLFTCISLVLNVIFIWLSFKNYHNSLLASASINFFVTLAIDNFIVRPFVIVIASLPLKNSQTVESYITKQLQIIQILHEERVMKKIFDMPKASPKQLIQQQKNVAIEIEPRINLQNTDNYLSTIQLTKSMRKQKLSPISMKKPISHEDENSLQSMLNSHEKKKARNLNGSFDFDKSLFEEKVDQEPPQKQSEQQIPEVIIEPRQQTQQQRLSSIEQSKRKMHSSKLIMISQDQSFINNFDQQNNEIENQEEEDVKDNKSTSKQKSLKDSSRNCDGLKISLHRSIEDEQNKENNQNEFEDEENVEVGIYGTRPHSTLEEDHSILNYGTGTHTSRRNGLLKINEDRKGEDLQEIDMNSPERRKQQLSKIIEGVDAQKPKKKKTKGKKYSLDPNRHVIKYSTGEPYLEFLPNLLNKQRQEKKKKPSYQQGSQQGFSRKVDMMNGFVNQSRLTKSVKRTKGQRNPIMKENDQNKIPEFIIEDFE